MALYACTIFLSAFLLFQVQPMLGRYILPWFGGTPGVWTTCLLFFQCFLVGGYLYAHGLISHLKPKLQGKVHLAVLVLSLLTLPITPKPYMKPADPSDPVGHILWLLARCVGLPYLVLSTTGPLLQGWFSRTHPGRSPYRLYSLSNIGSLLALVTYPLVFERKLRLDPQTWQWSACYALFVLLCANVAWRASRAAGDDDVPTAAAPAADGDERRLNPLDVLLWLGLAGCGTLLLLAVTNQLCQDVAVVPFLWVLPLSLYLLSFIICFDREQWYVRPLYAVLLVIALFVAAKLIDLGVNAPIIWQAAGYAFVLFVLTMSCHGELVRLKPGTRHLTLFYLMVSVGGALSGIFVAIICPRLFNGYYELQIGLTAAAVLYFLVVGRDLVRRICTETSESRRSVAIFGGYGAAILTAVSVVACWGIVGSIWASNSGVLAKTRNFYGVLQINQYDVGTPDESRTMRHGRILHGAQWTDPLRRLVPSTYFGPTSAISIAYHALPAPRNTGVIGLGTGTVAAFCEKGDRIVYYEINPQVLTIDDAWFTYLKDAAARGVTVETDLGDGRIVLEQQADHGRLQNFDLMAIDAFSSDAVPVHLLTKEATALYWRHLKPNGVLGFQITNRYLNLAPVCRGLAESCGKTALLIRDNHPLEGYQRSAWVLLTSNQSFINDPKIQAALTPWEATDKPLYWTDDFSNLFSVIRGVK
jgi:hypothetical protein